MRRPSFEYQNLVNLFVSLHVAYTQDVEKSERSTNAIRFSLHLVYINPKSKEFRGNYIVETLTSAYTR